MIRNRPLHTFAAMLAALVALAGSSPSATAQSAPEVVDRMLDAYEERAAGVEDYTLVQEFMGTRTVLYFEKEVREGRPVFALRSTSAAGAPMQAVDDVGVADLYAGGPELAEHARYAGRERVDGVDAHVLAVDDMTELDLDLSGAAEEAGFVPRTGRIYFDATSWVPVRMEFTGDVEGPEGPVEVRSRVDLQDYREVGGFQFPRTTVDQMEGLAAAVDPETRAQLEEMRMRIEELPEEQRAMVEEMMRDQLAQMESMLGGEDRMTVEMSVVEVRVNEGPPSP